MLIFLPPSEAKSLDGLGPAYPQTRNSWSAALNRVRDQVLGEVSMMCAGDQAAAVEALKLPFGVAAQACSMNTGVLTSATLPALDRYSGVLYQHLEVVTLPVTARTLADEATLIFSGGFGVVRGGELIPAYRIPAGAILPSGGTAASKWRLVLQNEVAVALHTHQAVDLWSSGYQSMWTPSGPLRSQVVPVRIVQRAKAGRRWVDRISSHHSKAVKGRLVRQMLLAGFDETSSAMTMLEQAGTVLGLELETRIVSGRSVPHLIDVQQARTRQTKR